MMYVLLVLIVLLLFISMSQKIKYLHARITMLEKRLETITIDAVRENEKISKRIDNMQIRLAKHIKPESVDLLKLTDFEKMTDEKMDEISVKVDGDK